MNNNPCLILGATGFVGINVCNEFDNNSIGFIKAPPKADVDLRDLKQTVQLLETVKPNTILNFAANVGSLNYVAQKAAEVISDNAKMVLALYEAVTMVCPEAVILNPIGSCTYPGNFEIYDESDWQNGAIHHSVLSYGSVRRFTYAVSECYRMQHGVRTISPIVNNMYGPYESTDPNKAHALSALVSKFVNAKHTNSKKVEIWGTGASIREWLYVKDFARLIIDIIKEPGKYADMQPFNISQNYGLSIKELVNIIAREVNYDGEVVYDTLKPDGAPVKIMGDKRFRQIFSEFEFTPLEAGIRATIDYYTGIYPVEE